MFQFLRNWCQKIRKWTRMVLSLKHFLSFFSYEQKQVNVCFVELFFLLYNSFENSRRITKICPHY